MAKHTSLPPRKSAPKPEPVKTKVQSAQQFLTDRVSTFVSPGERVYFIRPKLKGSSLSGILFFTHTEQFDSRVFEGMLKEAAAVVNETRIPVRRNEMAEHKVPVPNPVETNETLFSGDIDALQIVLCDKFGFKKLFYSTGEVEIIPTIVL